MAEAAKIFGIHGHEIKTYETTGDLDKTTPIDKVDGTDFFTDTIEKALLDYEIDIAVHSAKDLPRSYAPGLVIAAFTDPIDNTDALVSAGRLRLAELAAGAMVGTSSARRRAQVLALRPDLRVSDLRGNVDERIDKLDSGDYDAIVVASAALIRLGIEHRIAERLPFETAPLQGALAMQVRKEDTRLIEWLRRRSEKFI